MHSRIPKLGLLALACLTPTIRAQTPVLEPKAVYPVAECVEFPGKSTNTPLYGAADLTLLSPFAWLSTYSSFPANTTIALGIPQNYLVPGPIIYSFQPTVFRPGYDRAVMSLPLVSPTGAWTHLIWILGGSQASLPAPAFYAASVNTDAPEMGPAGCQETLIPEVPVVFANATAVHQKLATLKFLPPGRLTVEYSQPFYLACFNPDGGCGDSLLASPGVKLSNVTVENGAVYGDLAVSNIDNPFLKIKLRLFVGNSVVAFGNVPLVAAPACTGTIAPASLPSAVSGAAYSQTFSVPGTSDNFAVSGYLPAGLTLSGSTISGTPTEAGAFPLTVTAFPANNSCYLAASYTLSVSGSSCAADVTSQVAVTLGGLTRNLATNQWNQTVTLQNKASVALAGPIELALANLSANGVLVNSAGATNCALPSGQPYVQVAAGLAANQTVSVTLTFTNSTPSQSITYTPRILAGGAQV